jgi:hypothetical protein
VIGRDSTVVFPRDEVIKGCNCCVKTGNVVHVEDNSKCI